MTFRYKRTATQNKMKNFWESTIKYAVLIVNFLFALGMPIVKYSRALVPTLP